MNTPAVLTPAAERIAARINQAATGAIEVKRSFGGVAFVDMAQIMEFAKVMAVADIGIPKHLRGNVGACMMVTMRAVEWEMSPFAVADKSYLVNDKVAFESQLISAVINRRAPIHGRVKMEYNGTGTSRVCRVWADMPDGDTVEYTSPPFGAINPKNSPLWKNDPDQQLFYFSVRSWARRHFPDVLMGVYSKDEIEDSEPMPPPQDRKAAAGRLQARLTSAAPTSAGFSAEFVDRETGEIIENGTGDGTDEAPAIGPAVGDEPTLPAERRQGLASGGEPSPVPAAADDDDDFPGDRPATLIEIARGKAMAGRRAFDTWWASLSRDQQDDLKPEMPALMAAAKQAGV